MTISSWLNFGGPAPPGRGLRQGENFWRAVFASLSTFFIGVNCQVSGWPACVFVRVFLCMLLRDSALKEMSASESHFTSIHELMKNAVFMKQQIHYETFRRSQLLLLHSLTLFCLSSSLCVCLSVSLSLSLCVYVCGWQFSIGVMVMP